MRCVPDGAGLRRWAMPAALLAATLLGGCSSVSHVIADSWPHMLGGLPEGVPPRVQNPPEYMSVNETPAARDTKKLTPTERATTEAEMNTKRMENNARGVETKMQAPPEPPPQPAPAQ